VSDDEQLAEPIREDQLLANLLSRMAFADPGIHVPYLGFVRTKRKLSIRGIDSRQGAKHAKFGGKR
jgi:hypothetical protein